MMNIRLTLFTPLIVACMAATTACANSPQPPAPATAWVLAELLSEATALVQVEGEPQLVASPWGQAVQFDGDGDRLLLATNPVFGAEEFTLEALIHPDDVYPKNLEPRFLHIESHANPNRRVTMELRLTANGLWYFDAYIKSDIDQHTLIEPTLVHPVGRWVHTAITYKNGEFTSFINGEKELTAKVQYQAIGADAKTSLGARMNRIHWFAGAIYAVTVHHSALPAANFKLLPMLPEHNGKH